MDYYKQIKQKLVNNEIYKRVKDYSKNRNDLMTYYNVGKLIVEAQGGEKRAKYGDGLIKEYSKKLTNELGKGYSTRSLKRMRKFYLFQKGTPLESQLNWTHYTILLSLDSKEKIDYYTSQIIKYHLSKRQLLEKIKNKEYERLDNNTKGKLITKEKTEVTDFIKNPIIINNKYNYDEISEKILKLLILEDLDNFLKELGNGFTYIGNEYKIKLENRNNYIDLLLYNIDFNCYVVIELKVTELRKEHLGQIKIYMNYIDRNLRKIGQDKTIGIIICRKDNCFVIEYCSDDRIISREYKLV